MDIPQALAGEKFNKEMLKIVIECIGVSTEAVIMGATIAIMTETVNNQLTTMTRVIDLEVK